jgi:hypothetical protein
MTQQPDPDTDTDTQPAVEQRYQEMDSKLIQMQMLAELQAIRTTLTEAQTQPSAGESGGHESVTQPETYQCDHCEAEIAADDRWDHARDRHKSPPSRVPHMFEPA